MKRLLIAATALAGVAVGPSAWADGLGTSPQTTTFSVSATVLTQCSVSAAALSFGTITANMANPAETTITVTCTDGGAYTVALDQGLHPSGGTARMVGSNSNYLNYGLYQDSSHFQSWNNSTGTVTGTGNGTPQSLTVYGQVPGQSAAADSFTDTVGVTVTF